MCPKQYDAINNKFDFKHAKKRTAVASRRIRISETPGRRELIFASPLPDEGHTRHAGDLGHLRVDLDLAVPKVDAQLFLLLGREILVAEDWVRVGVSEIKLPKPQVYAQTTERSLQN